MATLERIRNRAGLLVIVVGVALFAFVIGDFLKSGSTFFNQSKQKVATVDGESIDIRDFQARVDNITNRYRQGSNLQEEQIAQIRESVFEEMIGSILFNREAEKVGFAVGREEKLDLIMGDNIAPVILQNFQNPQTGRFDKTQYLNYVTGIESTDPGDVPAEQYAGFVAAKEEWENLKKSVVTQKKMQKLSALLSASLSANSLDAKAAFDDSNENIDLKYVFQSYFMTPDSVVQVSDAEVAQLYKERKESFKQDAAQIVDYIAVPIVPSAEDFNTVAAQIAKASEELAASDNVAETVNEYSDSPFLDVFQSFNSLDENQRVFVQSAKAGDIAGPELNGETYTVYKLLGTKTAPDSVKVNLLNLPVMESAQLAKLTDSLINVVKSGKSFNDMTKELTGGQGTGDIGWHTEASLTRGLDAQASAALFNAKINEPFVLQTSYGSHIAQVTEKTNPVLKYRIATVSIAVNPSQDTRNKIYTELNQYIARNNRLASFRDSASAAGYVCRADVKFSASQPAVYPVRNSRQAIKWAFEHKKGDISEIFECENYFMTVAVEGSLKKGIAPLSSVSESLKREIINRKKGEYIVEKLKSGNYASLEEYAQAMNTEVKEVKYLTFATARIVGIGNEPAVNVIASLAEVNRLTEPFAGRSGVFVLQVTDKTAGTKEFDEALQKEELDRQTQSRIVQLLQTGTLLKDHAKIDDNRIRFY